METTIRGATLEDCEALCEIHVASIRELGRTHYSPEEVDAWAAGKTPARYEKRIAEQHVVVAERAGVPVGFGTFDPATGEIVQLYVHPDHAREGVGTRILEHLLQAARAAGCSVVHCAASLNARDFYVKAGFEAGPTRTRRFRSGGEVDCVAMTKRLA